MNMPATETTRSKVCSQAEQKVLAGGGKMGALMRGFDWAASPLGPVPDWPPILRTVVSLCLTSRFPTVIFWGPELRMFYNDAYLPMLADKHPAALGQAAQECWPEIWAIIGPMLRGVLDTGEATWSDDLLLPIIHNGAVGEHYFTFSYSPIRDETGRVCGVFCPVTETTARLQGERSEQALRHEAEAAHARVRTTLESITDAFFTLDRQWHFTYVNQRAKALWGRRDDVLGKNIWEEFPESESLIFGEQLRKAMADQVTIDFEGYYPPMGVWLAMRAYPSSDGVAVYLQNITARKEAEAERERLLADLQRANEEFQQFSYIVSHDLNEPLRTMRSYVLLLAQHLQGSLDGDAQEYLTFVTDAAQRMQQMLTDLLAYTHAGHALEFQAVDCEALLAEVVSDLHAAVTEQQATITRDRLPTVRGDPSRLRQVLLNLISNALKFCKEPPRIHVSAQREGGRWEFSVRDNGIGIDPRQFSRLFQVFQRLHTRAEYPGTGIGLAICKRVVEQHGGRIWVESVPGEGATFYFTISEVSIQ
jgi:PAS domain S-box-containing protein